MQVQAKGRSCNNYYYYNDNNNNYYYYNYNNHKIDNDKEVLTFFNCYN